MANNFNVGNFNTLKVDSNKVNNSPKNNNDKSALRKKFMLLAGIILGGIVLLLVVLMVASLFTSKTYSYNKLEEVLKNAAIKYYKSNDSTLPTTDDQVTEIDSATLISGEYMKDFSEMTEEGVTCTGRVVVSKKGKNYIYTPYLDCGEKYITKKLYEIVTDTKNIVTTNYGLYASNNGYVYKGEIVNNYVQMDNALWRIVKITSDNKIVLILADRSYESTSWDNRFNATDNFKSGLNNYGASRINEYLDKYYDNNKERESILSKEDRNRLVNYNLCIGKRAVNSDAKDNSVECGEILNDKKIGLLTASDYINASVDSNCTTTTSRSCQNYNYLNTDFQWWLMTASTTKSSSVFYVDRNGSIKEGNATNYTYVRPVVYLSDNVLFDKGKGSEKSPYKVR